MSKETLNEIIKDIAAQYWNSFQRPILLSQLPKEINKRLGSDYKLLLGTQNLKEFIGNQQAKEGYCLVEHPQQRAKIGIVPDGIKYDFIEAGESQESPSFSKQDVEGFMKILRSLNSSELSRMSLPAELVIRLLDKK